MKPLCSGVYKAFFLPYSPREGQGIKGLSLAHGRPPHWGRTHYEGGHHKDPKMQKRVLPLAFVARRKFKDGRYHRHGKQMPPNRPITPSLGPCPSAGARGCLAVDCVIFFPCSLCSSWCSSKPRSWRRWHRAATWTPWQPLPRPRCSRWQLWTWTAWQPPPWHQPQVRGCRGGEGGGQENLATSQGRFGRTC